MPAEAKDQRIPIMMSRREVAAIDAWRGHEPGIPSRAEAIRRLINRSLGGSAPAPEPSPEPAADRPLEERTLRKPPGRPAKAGAVQLPDFYEKTIRRGLGQRNTVEVEWLLNRAFGEKEVDDDGNKARPSAKLVERVLSNMGWRKALDDRDVEVWTCRTDMI